MRVERLAVGGDAVAAALRLRASIPAPESVSSEVAAIIERVRRGGDAALREMTTLYDTRGQDPPALRVTDPELVQAETQLDPGVRDGLRLSIENVRRVAAAGVISDDRHVEFEHHEVILRETPVRRAAVYVPGGRAPYPSTVVMGVVTARAAGVDEVAVCSPPGAGNAVNPAILAACHMAGATEVYRMGGVQAVAALAYGTASVQPVDVIVGPGNLYVQEAKRQVSGQVGIDGFAGPSDLLVIADDVATELVTLDLLAQAEHGPGSLVVAASTSTALLDELAERLAAAADTGALSWLVELETLAEAVTLSEAFAPEHLELLGPLAEQLAGQITRAGCVFVGSPSGTAFGDYIAGSNHTLPTNGSARFASALSARHFRRGFTEVRIGDGSDLARSAAPIARAEGFELHARSMEIRIRENGPR